VDAILPTQATVDKRACTSVFTVKMFNWQQMQGTAPGQQMQFYGQANMNQQQLYQWYYQQQATTQWQGQAQQPPQPPLPEEKVKADSSVTTEDAPPLPANPAPPIEPPKDEKPPLPPDPPPPAPEDDAKSKKPGKDGKVKLNPQETGWELSLIREIVSRFLSNQC